ncbi:MAG: prolipoprotein diacylglyceryl transferase [Candidatus Komeilibacteria bacterium]|jgi:phosphatidylglycerol---prolipoprotein diacylglyceryl transferase|nr:prolipoprotein diacylglyceryl transferase [Candidatus Komeilibacteria bacterium]MBT4447932.1 prolipoprotein diacylglyceryl transferase [Candidatus Komeilibacteria bacterium]
MFWHEYLPEAVFLTIGPLTIHWYGLILVLAIIIATLVARQYFLKKSIIKASQFEDLVFYLIIISLIGARFGHVVFFNFSYYLQNPIDVFKVWHGGLSIQGALLFGFLTVVFWAHRNKINFWKLTDGIVLALPLGQAIGRWGNYFNQELFGGPTNAWWGIPIAFANRVEGYRNFIYFHPTFFYESILNIILFIVLYTISKKFKLKIGVLTLTYFIGYGLIRFFMEFVRIDDTLILAGLRLPQLISALLILASCFTIYYIYKLKKGYESNA